MKIRIIQILVLPLWATSRIRVSLDQISTAGVTLDVDMRLISGEPYGFTDLLEETGGLLHAQTFGDACAVFLIDLVEEAEHIIPDVLSAGTQGLADVVDKVLSLVLGQNFAVQVSDLLEFLSRVNKFIPPGESLHTSEAWSVYVVRTRPNIHRVLIVGQLLLLVLLNIHEAILDKVVHMERAVHRNLIMINAQTVHLCVLI
jgi:hypothetical protein